MSATNSEPSLTDFQALPAVIVKGNVSSSPQGLTIQQVKSAYNLPDKGGAGTIAIISAFDHPDAEDDLNVFSRQFDLTACTIANGCFESHKMTSDIRADSQWGLEVSLDTQWAHAIAPTAKILLVEAASDSGTDLLAAVDYARSRYDVVAIAMPWGGQEFVSEAQYDDYFVSGNHAVFFAAAGNGSLLWPAASGNVLSVGGTTLLFDQTGLSREVAWKNGGGGLSKYVNLPSFQSYAVPIPKGKRAVPDVAYVADPDSGVSVYGSYNGKKGWYIAGGTSVGVSQWAALRAIGGPKLNLPQIYMDAMANSSAYFRDIAEGGREEDGFYCKAGTGYDYITGLGTPLTTSF